MPILSEAKFFSVLAYESQPSSDRGRRNKDFVKAIKHGNRELVRRAVLRITEITELAALLESGAALIPAPRSTPVKADYMTPARLICTEIRTLYPNTRIVECLERHTAVPKAAFCRREDRPTPEQHFESIRLASPVSADLAIVVDDVITSGAQMIVNISRVNESPEARSIIGLGLVRTFSDPLRLPDESTMFHPTSGIIRFGNGRAWREP